MTLDEIEIAMIRKSLDHFQGNLTHVAEALGISRAALYRRLDKHGIKSLRLQTRLIAYWAVLHLLILVLTLYLYEELGLWVLLVEAALNINAFAGWRLIKKIVEPLQFLESGVKFIEGEEFTARFTEVGQVEMDRLIETYNRMLASLQDQRIKTGEQRGILERLLQATPVGVIALDFEGAISIVNPAAARFLGSTPESLVGLKLPEASAS